MSSLQPPNDSAKYFTHDWIITVPSRPDLRFLRCSPSLFNTCLAITSDPANSPFSAPAVRDRLQNEQSREADKERMLSSYLKSPAKRNNLILLVELDGKIVGSGGLAGAVGNAGLQFIASARGRGLGKVTMRLLLRLSNELDTVGVRVGTMKGNLAMRAVMKSLGVEETDAVFEIPGLGVVNDVLYNGIRKEDWKDFDFQVEFLNTGPGIGGAAEVINK